MYPPGLGRVQELGPRFQAVLLAADIAVRPVKIRRRTDFCRSWVSDLRDVGQSFSKLRIASNHEEGDEC